MAMRQLLSQYEWIFRKKPLDILFARGGVEDVREALS